MMHLSASPTGLTRGSIFFAKKLDGALAPLLILYAMAWLENYQRYISYIERAAPRPDG
jgi:hypothetical protein